MSKPEVLFLHGAGGGAWEWNVWIRVFKAHGFHCHALDLLPSASGLAETLLEDYSQQVRQYLLAMESPKIIVGASLGGLLALMNGELADALLLSSVRMRPRRLVDSGYEFRFPDLQPALRHLLGRRQDLGGAA